MSHPSKYKIIPHYHKIIKSVNKSMSEFIYIISGKLKVDFYKEWIKVPDVWKREYSKIRSNNDVLGSIGGAGLFITIFGIFIFILVRTQKKDVRWKTAFSYAFVIALLLILRAFFLNPHGRPKMPELDLVSVEYRLDQDTNAE